MCTHMTGAAVQTMSWSCSTNARMPLLLNSNTMALPNDEINSILGCQQGLDSPGPAHDTGRIAARRVRALRTAA